VLIKEADDCSKRLALLEALEQSPLLDDKQKKWLKDELWNLRKGRSGERNAAYYIDSALKDSANLAVIHDLRLEWEGESAQIDHLVISRGLIFYLLETKNFSGNLSINEHGEFTVFYGNTRQGIPSPILQSRRHEKVLAKWLEQLGIGGRFGSRPQFFHAVLVAPTSTINRPAPAKFDTSNVIKADAFDEWRQQHVEKRMSFGQTLTAMTNLCSGDTVREWAQKLVDMHRPLNPLQLPDFMKPREPADAIQAVQHQAPVVPVNAENITETDSRKRKLICCTCDKPISFAEGKFCWNNERRFGGLQYCREHQRQYA